MNFKIAFLALSCFATASHGLNITFNFYRVSDVRRLNLNHHCSKNSDINIPKKYLDTSCGDDSFIIMYDNSNIVGWAIIDRGYDDVSFFITGFKVVKNKHTQKYIKALLQQIIKRGKKRACRDQEAFVCIENLDITYCNVKAELFTQANKMGFRNGRCRIRSKFIAGISKFSDNVAEAVIAPFLLLSGIGYLPALG